MRLWTSFCPCADMWKIHCSINPSMKPKVSLWEGDMGWEEIFVDAANTRLDMLLFCGKDVVIINYISNLNCFNALCTRLLIGHFNIAWLQMETLPSLPCGGRAAVTGLIPQLCLGVDNAWKPARLQTHSRVFSSLGCRVRLVAHQTLKPARKKKKKNETHCLLFFIYLFFLPPVDVRRKPQNEIQQSTLFRGAPFKINK